MRLNLFSHNQDADPQQPAPQQQPPSQQPAPQQQPPSQQPSTAASPPQTGKTFPADEVVWGIVIRNGFDELDDPWYHRGTTQHAYLEGNDNVSICGFRPPQSGPRSRRRSRLGLPTAGEHPMCGSCARMVVAPRPRVPVPVQNGRPPVAVPVAPAANRLVPPPVAVPVAQPVAATAPTPAAPSPQAAGQPVSPWVRNRTGADESVDGNTTVELGTTHDSGLLDRGIHTEIEQD